MSEPDPFASPYHQVNLPGQPNAPLPPGYDPPMPMPMPMVDARELALPRPVTVTSAFWCWIVGAILVVLVLPGLYYTGLDAVVADLGSDSLSAGEAEIMARLMPVLFAVALAVLSVPYVIAAFKMRSGRDWARILLTVLGVLGGLFALGMLLGFMSGEMPFLHWGLGMAWSLVLLAVCALGVVAMFLPASNTYMRSVTG